MRLPAPPFTHLRRLTDAGGVYEHALLTVPRHEHGYCVDDVARALVVASREGAQHADLVEQYLAFVVGAQAADGRFHNRRDTALTWTDEPTLEDCWGRALWGLGVAATSDIPVPLRTAALQAFELGATQRSPWSRATCFAAVGAAHVLRAHPDHCGARALLGDAAAGIGRPAASTHWPWPEARLTYGNAVVPEVLLAAGDLLDRPDLVADGLLLLAWLLELQTREGHLSVVPVGGWGRGGATTLLDQQPIEVAALADACALAHDITGDGQWLAAVDLAAAWFLGDNDNGTPLHDAVSGGGCDGLQVRGRNENQGAESTLALISTWQQAHRLALCPR